MKRVKVGQIVTTGTGPDTFMGTVTKVSGAYITIKYVDFIVPRIVHVNFVKVVLA